MVGRSEADPAFHESDTLYFFGGSLRTDSANQIADHKRGVAVVAVSTDFTILPQNI
jgi:hypothetical protein